MLSAAAFPQKETAQSLKHKTLYPNRIKLKRKIILNRKVLPNFIRRGHPYGLNSANALRRRTHPRNPSLKPERNTPTLGNVRIEAYSSKHRNPFIGPIIPHMQRITQNLDRLNMRVIKRIVDPRDIDEPDPLGFSTRCTSRNAAGTSNQ